MLNRGNLKLTPRLDKLLLVWCKPTNLSISSSLVGHSWLETEAVFLLEAGATGLGVALLLPVLDVSIGEEWASDKLTSSGKNWKFYPQKYIKIKGKTLHSKIVELPGHTLTRQ